MPGPARQFTYVETLIVWQSCEDRLKIPSSLRGSLTRATGPPSSVASTFVTGEAMDRMGRRMSATVVEENFMLMN